MNENTCVDLDECAENNPCDTQAVCTNTFGTVECQCLDGFIGDGLNCLDINECDMDACMANSLCTNSLGSFSCKCKLGFVLHENECIDLNECQDSNPCDDNAVCTNTFGTVECHCKDGFVGDGISCEDINECSMGACAGEHIARLINCLNLYDDTS